MFAPAAAGGHLRPLDKRALRYGVYATATDQLRRTTTSSRGLPPLPALWDGSPRSGTNKPRCPALPLFLRLLLLLLLVEFEWKIVGASCRVFEKEQTQTQTQAKTKTEEVSSSDRDAPRR